MQPMMKSMRPWPQMRTILWTRFAASERSKPSARRRILSRWRYPLKGFARSSKRPDRKRAGNFPVSGRPYLQRDAERQLHARAADVAKHAEKHKKEGRYREALQDIAGLRPEVDRFFDDVMVMVEERAGAQEQADAAFGIALRVLDDCGFLGDYHTTEHGK